VLANEVRNLAEESSHAASKITGLIQDVQAKTVDTVDKIESFVHLFYQFGT
jgi:methyl-accepting chemotaxis protein